MGRVHKGVYGIAREDALMLFAGYAKPIGGGDGFRKSSIHPTIPAEQEAIP
jgi:hypothetical protein